jgi:hypothetical protein
MHAATVAAGTVGRVSTYPCCCYTPRRQSRTSRPMLYIGARRFTSHWWSECPAAAAAAAAATWQSGDRTWLPEQRQCDRPRCCCCVSVCPAIPSAAAAGWSRGHNRQQEQQRRTQP